MSGSLQEGDVRPGNAAAGLTTVSLWEQGCSGTQRVSRRKWRLSRRIREQARSHVVPRGPTGATKSVADCKHCGSELVHEDAGKPNTLMWGMSQPSRESAHSNRHSHAALGAQEKWRKAAGVEPARERLPSPTGFEARPRHRARLPSMIERTVSERFTPERQAWTPAPEHCPPAPGADHRYDG